MVISQFTAPTIEPIVSCKREAKQKRQSGIYQILCKPTGKVYIGSAVNLAERKYDHFKTLRTGTHHNLYLQRAWNKYGNDAFEYSVLERCEKGRLTELEQSYIDLLKAAVRDYGFNICPNARSALGYKHTIEAKRKMSEKLLGLKRSKETREKMSISRTGKKMNLSPQQRNALSQRFVGNRWNSGRKHTDETRSKLKGNKNAADWVRTEEYKNNLSIGHHPFSIEQCNEIREIYSTGLVTMTSLAIQHGCHRQTIGNIINRNIRAYQ